jgi:hypothetical protein
VFRNEASGISEEYRFFNGKSDLNNQSYTHPNGSMVPFDLPKWLDCSTEANSKRDFYKTFLEVRHKNSDEPSIQPFQQEDIELSKKYSGVYDNWNTMDNENGECTFGSGKNQMTMTYISFTGWLR